MVQERVLGFDEPGCITRTGSISRMKWPEYLKYMTRSAATCSRISVLPFQLRPPDSAAHQGHRRASKRCGGRDRGHELRREMGFI